MIAVSLFIVFSIIYVCDAVDNSQAGWPTGSCKRVLAWVRVRGTLYNPVHGVEVQRSAKETSLKDADNNTIQERGTVEGV